MEKQYKVSVIIPIYNAEKYLRDCLDSLAKQTIESEEIEILLIDDGSTDDSLQICKEYMEYNSNIKLFSQENSGPSVARNLGIQKAQGQYIMYLDADDTLGEETIKSVTDFFDKHYDEVDLVSYYDQYFQNGKPLPAHIRYKYMKKTGIYDLNNAVFALQVRLNICVKNMGENNVYFDTKMTYQEDQKYCCQILMKKMKMGFCREGQYNYNKNEGSIVGSQTYAYYMFEQSTGYFESIFAQFDHVPQYFQALFIHDISWKLSQHVLFPFHYEDEAFNKAMNRLINLLKKVDTAVIMNHPSVDTFHKYYFLQLRNSKDITIFAEKKQIALLENNKILYKTKLIEIIMSKFLMRKDKLLILAYVKEPIFNFTDEKPKVYAKIETDDGIEIKELELNLSSDSYYKARVITNHFWSFYFEYDTNKIKGLEFLVEIDGITYGTKYYFMPRTPFNSSLKRYSFIYGNVYAEFVRNKFRFSKISEIEKKQVEDKLDHLCNNTEAVIRRRAARKLQSRNIWLYYDCKGVKCDNGYYQFMHDIDKADGVERYYISNNDFSFIESLIPEKLRKNIIQFGSEMHKRLFIACDKIITAFIEYTNIYPFSQKDRGLYTDLFHFQIIYLQHGILHAHLPWKYTPERCDADKIVVSSNYELENFHKTYFFRNKDILGFGMPRFDHIDRSIKPNNKILFAPSWRQYLIGENRETGEWICETGKFIGSNYYQEIQNFLENEQLHKILQDNNLYMDFKLHPIFTVYQDCFTMTSDRIKFADDSVVDEEYTIFITDFSSFVFDFAYLKRPIIYFVPDYVEFLSGMNQYRELDLPFEKSFGNLCLDAQTAILEIQKIVNNKLNPEDIFLDRMDDFYLDMENSSEKIYRYLVD